MANRVELIYGASQSGKTTWGLSLAEYFFVKRGKKTRWYIGDGGGETIYNSGLVDEGIVEVWNYANRANPFSTLQMACDGYWPEDINDPQSKLIPKHNFEDYGMFVYEGLSVGADYMMSSKTGGLADRAAKGEKIGQDTPYVVMEEGMKFGGNPPSHFGFVQRRMIDLIERTRSLPLPFVLWTAHERKAEEPDFKGVYVIGPDVVGQALTTKIGAYFGNSIHMHVAEKKEKKKDALTGRDIEVVVADHRAYTRKHSDPMGNTSIKYYANNRMPKEFADEMPEFLSPADPVKFYQIIESAKTKKKDLLAKALGEK